MKQTAVEWLIEKLGEYFPHEIGGIHLLVEQAKEMEKEQIINAHIEGQPFATTLSAKAEQHYNETYGKQEIEKL